MHNNSSFTGDNINFLKTHIQVYYTLTVRYLITERFFKTQFWYSIETFFSIRSKAVEGIVN